MTGDIDLRLQIRDDFSPALTRLYVIFGMAGLVVRDVALPKPRLIEYAPRTWTDLHLEQLNYALLGAIYVLVLFVAWLAVR